MRKIRLSRLLVMSFVVMSLSLCFLLGMMSVANAGATEYTVGISNLTTPTTGTIATSGTVTTGSSKDYDGTTSTRYSNQATATGALTFTPNSTVNSGLQPGYYKVYMYLTNGTSGGQPNDPAVNFEIRHRDADSGNLAVETGIFNQTQFSTIGWLLVSKDTYYFSGDGTESVKISRSANLGASIYTRWGAVRFVPAFSDYVVNVRPTPAPGTNIPYGEVTISTTTFAGASSNNDYNTSKSYYTTTNGAGVTYKPQAGALNQIRGSHPYTYKIMMYSVAATGNDTSLPCVVTHKNAQGDTVVEPAFTVSQNQPVGWYYLNGGAEYYFAGDGTETITFTKNNTSTSRFTAIKFERVKQSDYIEVIGTPTFTATADSAASPILNLTGATAVYPRIAIRKDASTGINTTIIVAVYDENNILKGAKSDVKTISSASTTTTIINDIGITDLSPAPSAGWKARVFIWDGLGTMKPFDKATSVTAN